jgi:hypothetical protein
MKKVWQTSQFDKLAKLVREGESSALLTTVLTSGHRHCHFRSSLGLSHIHFKIFLTIMLMSAHCLLRNVKHKKLLMPWLISPLGPTCVISFLLRFQHRITLHGTLCAAWGLNMTEPPQKKISSTRSSHRPYEVKTTQDGLSVCLSMAYFHLPSCLTP